jgi:Mrp family chromosome partitioning ATPase/capsule polysaccharide export protein KpsE/RkpR
VPTLTIPQIVTWLVGNLKVTNDGHSLTIVVSFTSDSSERAAAITNAVAQTYLNDQAVVKTRATMMASDWLGQRVNKIREDLEKSEAAVDEYRRKAGLLPVRGGTIPAERLGDLNTQLGNARSERMRAEIKLQTARQSDPETLPEIIASPTIQALRKELTQINSEIAGERAYSTFYKLKVLDDRAGVVRKQMTEERNRILAGLASEVEIARKRESQMAQSFQEMESQLGDAAHSGVRLIQLQREADANRSIYETFLARYKQAMEQESLAMPDARLISQAVPPEDPIYPKKSRFLLVGVFGGLAIGGALAFLREGFDRRIRQASDIENATGVPVFGFLPKVSRWRGLQPQDYPVTDPHSQFCTALMRIHTALGPHRSSNRKQVILVTSAEPGDGKTSFCTGLARSLANNRMRVLVIDADPYRSRVAAAFGASTDRALDPISEQAGRLGDLVRADTKSSAHFMPAPSRDDLQFLFHSGGFETLIEEARQTYDAIIIDTPPVMTSADAALIGRFADTRLLLVRWGRTCWDQMTAAVGFLRLCRVGLDGIVIVGADTNSAGYTQMASYDTAPPDHRFVRPSSDRRLTEVE